MMVARPRRIALSLLTVTLALGIGCSKVIDPPVPRTCVGLSNQACAALKVVQANASLEAILFANLNGNPLRPADVDVRAPLALYEEALVLDPGNNDAHFGAAILGLFALSSDAEVNAAFDEWKAYLDQHVPFEVPGAGLSRLRPLGVPLSFSTGRTALALPFDLVSMSVLAQARASMVLADPQLSRVQAILRERVLPRLTETRGHLGTLVADPNYRFIVTPRMQGDEWASPAEIDRTDLLALRAACDLLAASCHVAVAYELNFGAYDSVTLVRAISRGSGWLALRSDGATHMRDARTALLASIDGVDAAITSLRSETDNQDDDIIKTDPHNFRPKDADSIQVNLPNTRLALEGGYTRVDDWDGDPTTPPVALTVRVGALFSSPVADWKELLPPYSASARRRVHERRYESNNGTTPKPVVVPDSAYYTYSYWLTYDQGVQYESAGGDEFLRAGAQAVAGDRLAVAQSLPGWDGWLQCSVNFYGSLPAGTQNVAFRWSESRSVGSRWVVVPVITWDASTFDTWEWPQPTLNGLLPGMGSSAQLLSTFGIRADRWEREVLLDWADSGYRFPRLTPLRAHPRPGQENVVRTAARRVP